ncbi:MAG: tautomerase family protein [Anaeromyxobacteraceae bacterium]
MPFLDVRLAPRRTEQGLPGKAASILAELTARYLKKKPEVTAVAIQLVEPTHWFVAGRSLAEQGKASFFLDVRVTAGTNTKDELAAYVREVFRAMGVLLGALQEESYVHVHEVPAHGYGYGGLTQEHRYVRSTPEEGPRR